MEQDFGEYQESYYSVQTTEGEQISQLIAGYIDIILKKASNKKYYVKTTSNFPYIQPTIFTVMSVALLSTEAK